KPDAKSMEPLYEGGDAIAMVNFLWEYEAYAKNRGWDDNIKSARVMLYVTKSELTWVKQAIKRTKTWIELRQRLFDIASYVAMTNDRMEYEDCGLKGIEQVDDNKINKRVTNIVSKTNNRKKQTTKIKIANVPDANE
ncbi:29598_t:CDS:1, partial [Racocetra persica]